ncbi:MAG: ATP-binding protein [Acidobacteriota bacterium]
MQRRILIIDDYDDLASSLKDVFSEVGHDVFIVENRNEALAVDDFSDYDLVITDLDVENFPAESSLASNGNHCAPAIDSMADNPVGRTHLKAFKICASNFRLDGFDEAELKNLVETILNYKIQFVDKKDIVRDIRENIEFELPSSIGIMHSILDYLMKRVEKLGVVKAEQSNLFVALDEAFVNAIKHGNKFDAGKLVRITAEVSSAEARFTIEDQGEGFDVNSIPDPRDPQNLFKASGRGVLFIYNIMDEVKYNERGNRLTMIKRSEQNAPTETNSSS